MVVVCLRADCDFAPLVIDRMDRPQLLSEGFEEVSMLVGGIVGK